MRDRAPAREVEIFYPRQAPHLAPIAAKIEAKLLRHFELLPTEILLRLHRTLGAIAQEREAFARLRRRTGIKQPGDVDA
jgi:hypothetical protein